MWVFHHSGVRRESERKRANMRKRVEGGGGGEREEMKESERKKNEVIKDRQRGDRDLLLAMRMC